MYRTTAPPGRAGDAIEMAAAHALHITEDHPFLDGDERPRRGPPRCPSRNGHRIADRGVELQRALADLAQGRRDNSP